MRLSASRRSDAGGLLASVTGATAAAVLLASVASVGDCKFVHAAPNLLVTLVWTFAYSNYAEAFVADEPYSVWLILFPFWSLVTAYVGVRTVFDVSPWKARLWFVILPGLLYVFVLGLLAALLALFLE